VVHQLLDYADDVNVLGGSVHIIKKNTKPLVVARKDTGLEVNADKTKYMVITRGQNAGRSQNIKTDNSSFEMVEEFKYLRTNLTEQNSIQEEIKSRMKSGNVCYHSVQKLLSSTLRYKTLNIKTYRIIIFLVVLYGCEIWSLTLREEGTLGGSENRVMRRISGPKSDEVTGSGGNYIMRSLMIRTPQSPN